MLEDSEFETADNRRAECVDQPPDGVAVEIICIPLENNTGTQQGVNAF
jgi:hypothetical protein